MQLNAIIVAGGSGSRMQQSLPKQFIPIAGKPILIHTIEAFLRFSAEIQLILVLPKDHLPYWEALKSEFLMDTPVHVAIGGASRFQSVRSGLQYVKEGLVAIHDGVRPLIEVDVIHKSFETAQSTGSGVVMVPLKDSIRQTAEGHTVSRNRSEYFAVQTPQTFQVDLIKAAFEVEEQSFFTDDASVYEYAGYQVTKVEGSYRNIKITTPEDLIVAEALLSNGK